MGVFLNIHLKIVNEFNGYDCYESINPFDSDFIFLSEFV